MNFYDSGARALGFKISVKCKWGVEFVNSYPLIDSVYKINRRLVFVFRMLGVYKEGLNLFCGQGISNNLYYACL